MKKQLFILCLLTSMIMSSLNAQTVPADSQNRFNDPKMAWWKDAKFGMFIHWGLYSVPAGKWGDVTSYGEWIMNSARIPRATYSQLTKKFNPTLFNAEEWVKLAKEAGQKYIVITSKHHDGFAMFKSDASPYNIYDATPFKRDPLKELAEACRKYDMKLGFYYSQAQDWYHPGGAVSGKEWDPTHKGDMLEYIKKIALPQVKEILSNYGDIAILWWDTPVNMTEEMARIVSEPLKNHPDIITNNRLGQGFDNDFETPEQFIPSTGFPGRNWEVCMTMNGHWGYNAFDEHWKSTDELLKKLIDIVSKGGNLLLNVGPNQYGVIPEVCRQNLREIGAWLNINGEAVYGTVASPFPHLSWGRATRKGQNLYLHVFNWPEDRILRVPLLNKVTSARLLADKGTKLKVTKSKEGVNIYLPAYAPDKTASVIALTFEGEPKVLPIPSHGKPAKVSSSKNASDSEKLTDGDPTNRWTAKKGDREATIEIDLGEPISIQCMALVEPWKPWDNQSQQIELEAYTGGKWTSIYKTQTKGTGITEQVPVTKAQKFRLILNNAKTEPSLQEVLLYRAE